MPLIRDLKNHAMRPRHWASIQQKMQRQFDHKAEDFTLERIIHYGFDQYADPINEISGAATKEFAIEQVCQSKAHNNKFWLAQVPPFSVV